VDGLAVVGLPFASGDILCLRRFPASSFGPGYDSVWHRSADGDWTMYVSIAPEQSCPRFFGAAIARAVETPITIDWTGDFTLRVGVPAAGLDWELRMAGSPIERLMNLMMALMPRSLYRNNLVLSFMSLVSTVLLGAGRFRLRGRVPNRQWFQAGPRRLWSIPESRASIAGRDLGPLGPLAAQATLGEFPMPQRGLFMIGGISFEAYAPGRHLPPRAGSPLRAALAGAPG
jgi:hypothetical protein